MQKRSASPPGRNGSRKAAYSSALPGRYDRLQQASRDGRPTRRSAHDLHHRPASPNSSAAGTSSAAELGGHGHTTAAGIDRLRLDAEHATLILSCMEEAPGDCHHAICGPHFPEAIHIFRDEQLTAGALQAALNAGDATRLYCEPADLFR